MVSLTIFTKAANHSSAHGSSSASPAAAAAASSPDLEARMSTDMHDALGRLYDQPRGPNAPLLSHAAFHRFLVHVQGEPAVAFDRDAYSLGEFLYVGSSRLAPASANVAQTIVDTVAEKTGDRTRTPSPLSCALAGDASAPSPDPRDSVAGTDAAASRPRQPLPLGEPIVTHGWTLTTPCGFREVCEAIRDSAFVNNHLPIISLEVHADLEQQEVMVSIMRDVWKDLLVSEPLDGCDPKFRVPALEALLDKILVKVKRAPARMIAPQGTPDLLAAGSSSDDTSASDDERLALHRSLRPEKSETASATTSERSAKARPICDSLAELAIYTRSERFESLDTPQAKKPSHVFSIAENRILEMCQKHHREVFLHNKNYFMRAFPAVHRIGSSNPDPSPFWRRGV